MIHGIASVYRGSCPNCGGVIEEDRLVKGLPCSRCLPRPPEEVTIGSIARSLKANGALRGYYWIWSLEERFRDFEGYFRSKTGSLMWSAQKSWARRLLKGESLAIIAPTGVGKSTLLGVYSAYAAERLGWKVLYLVPTENLVRQAADRITSYAGQDLTAYYYSRLSKSRREEALESIRRMERGVIVVTTGFLHRRMRLLEPKAPFNTVIVDDVDSLLRNSRNVERVLALLGFDDETVKASISLVEAKLKLFKAVSGGNERLAERLRKTIAELEGVLVRSQGKGGAVSQLVIASATGRPRGYKHLAFRELLGFEVGGGSDYLRNIADYYSVCEDTFSCLAATAARLGDGILVFVSQRHGREAAVRVASALEEAGLKVSLALTGSRKPVDEFAEGRSNVLVGMASRYGVIVRGLDMPSRAKYALFLGVPSVRMSLEEGLLNPRRLLRVLGFAADQGEEWAREAYSRLSRALERLPEPVLVTAALKGKIEASGLLAEAASMVAEYSKLAYEWVYRRAAESGGILRIGGIVISSEGPGWIVSPDHPTYIQASGRTSRLYKGVMTFGVSIVFEENKAFVEALEERLRWLSDTRFAPLEKANFRELSKRVEESRRGKGRRVQVKTVLMVVESPTKARTIAWFWGRPGRRRAGPVTVYETSVADAERGVVYLLQVTATRGHITDLATDVEGSLYGVREGDGVYKPVYDTVKRCMECWYQFAEDRDSCPRCGSMRIYDSRLVVDLLRRLASEVDEVVIATDPDREGEKIAWDVMALIKPFNPNVRRGRFHEVTPRAVLEALRASSGFNESLVKAQEARRVVDRWIGFSLSSHLWVKYGKPWLGAGRVQTPVLGWIVDAYRMWTSTRGYYVILDLDSGGRIVLFTSSRDEAVKASNARTVRVVEVASEWVERSPPPPYTTDSLILDASRMGLNASLAMRVAQDLFESGLITYHRTDSTRVSPQGMAVAREYLASVGLEELYRGRQWGEGGAHEAIRPVRPLDAASVERAVLDGSLRVPVRLTRVHLRLYDRVFRRFVASQMASGRLLTVKASIDVAGLTASIEGVARAEGGYTLVYPPRLTEWLRNVRPGDKLAVTSSKIVRGSRERLLTSGDVVARMKSEGIGRPSTYAKAIEANIRHGYVIESSKRRYLVPTKTGVEVYHYLSSNFPELVSVETSRDLESLLDRVESGALKAKEVVERVRRLSS